MLSQFYTSGFAPSLRLTVNKRWLENWYGAAVTAHITFCAFAPSKIFQKTSENKGWVVGNFIQVSIVGLVVRMILPIWSDPLGESFSFLIRNQDCCCSCEYQLPFCWRHNETLLCMLGYAVAANTPLYAPHKPHKILVTCFGINSGMDCQVLHEHEVIAHLVS